jgi:hypothetical protein
MRKIIDIEVDGIDWADAPDFCDAYISSARWEDTGEELTEDELEALPGEFIYEQVEKAIY